MKGGINFAPALKNPGSMAFSKQWKQAVGNVKSQDMPPEDFAKTWINDGGPKGYDRLVHRSAVYSTVKNGKIVPLTNKF